MLFSDDELRAFVDDAREQLVAVADHGGGAELPGVVRSLARGHLGLALRGSEASAAPGKRVASIEFRAADELFVLASLSRATGTGAELYLTDAYDDSFVPNASGAHSWSGLWHWIYGLEAQMWCRRSENYEPMTKLSTFATSDGTRALASYAYHLGKRSLGSTSEYDGPVPCLEDARAHLENAGAWRSMLEPRIAAWTAFDRRDVRALAVAASAIADVEANEPDAITLGIGVSLSASTVVSWALHGGLALEIRDPRIVVWRPKTH